MNYKKPAFWLILLSLAVVLVVAVCLLTNPPAEKTTLTRWFDILADPNEDYAKDIHTPVELPEFPGVTFCIDGALQVVDSAGNTTEFTWGALENAYFTDLNGDGYPELCASVSNGSGIVVQAIQVYDHKNGKQYALAEPMQYDYHLFVDEGCLWVEKQPYGGGETLLRGKLTLENESLTIGDT